MFTLFELHASPSMGASIACGVRRPHAQRREASAMNALRFSVFGVGAETVRSKRLEPSAYKARVTDVQFTRQLSCGRR